MDIKSKIQSNLLLILIDSYQVQSIDCGRLLRWQRLIEPYVTYLVTKPSLFMLLVLFVVLVNDEEVIHYILQKETERERESLPMKHILLLLFN